MIGSAGHWSSSVASLLTGAGLALAWWKHALAAAFGMPQIAEITRPEWDQKPTTLPRVTIVVPARNEAKTIEPALRSLMALDYPDYEVVVVNDRSTDATGEIVERLCKLPEAHGCLRVIHVKDLPPGWLGKTHAMWLAASQSQGEWILFTDADVVFRPDALRRAAVYAEQKRIDHVVLFPSMVMKTWGERMMIALFQALFVFAHRPWKIADPNAKDHMGVGAFNMIRRSTYEAIGTYERLRLSVLDDMNLGELVKRQRFAQHCVFGQDLARIHWAQGALGVVRNLNKNFFAELKYSVAYALAAAAGLLFLNLGPFVGVLVATGIARLFYGAAVLAILAIYRIMSRRSSISPAYVLLHPISSLLLCYTILQSTLMALSRGGVVWRGTKYSLAELREANSVSEVVGN